MSSSMKDKIQIRQSRRRVYFCGIASLLVAVSLASSLAAHGAVPTPTPTTTPAAPTSSDTSTTAPTPAASLLPSLTSQTDETKPTSGLPQPQEEGDPEFWNRQYTLEVIADRVKARGKQQDRQYTTLAVSASSNEIIVYRADVHPETGSAIYGDLAEPGMSLRFESSLMTTDQIDRIKTVVKNEFNTLLAQGILLTTWGPSDQSRSHYVISYDPNHTSGNPPHTLTAEQIITAITAIIPADLLQFVSFTPGEPLHPLTRSADTSPWWGGALLVGPGGALDNNGNPDPNAHSTCTGNFIGKSTTNGAYYLVTAYHCVKPGDDRMWNKLVSGTVVGTVTDSNPNEDVAFVKIASNTAQSRIYNGAYPNIDSGSYNIAAGDPIALNDSVEFCNDGFRLGLTCSLSIWYGDAGYSYQNGYSGFTYSVPDALRWHTPDINIAGVAGGDSGGPAYSNSSNNTIANPRGIISQGAGAVPCPTRNPTVGSTCYYSGYMPSFVTAIAGHNLDTTF